MRKRNEKCAVFGVSVLTDTAAQLTYTGLVALQHRGQEGAGIATVNDKRIDCYKNIGLVSEVFSGETLGELPKAKIAIGHTRYSTTGGARRENTGPFVTEYLTGRIATAHNGNITNSKEIRERLCDVGIRFHSTCDSEVASSLIAFCITQEKNAVEGIIKAANQMRGAFSFVIATSKAKLIAVRDPHGYRPLCIGRNENGMCVASESCALDACGFDFVRDILPGEVIVVENGKIVFEKVVLARNKDGNGLCVFEYIYLARPDSIIDGLSVYHARFNMGRTLAAEHPADADIVCGVPDSGTEAASGYAAASGIPLVAGFIKNRYIGRSFICPTQDQRASAVVAKLNPLKANLDGKRIILVDDSIVRGTTIEKIVKRLRAAGAKEIHMRVSSPPFVSTCSYGTDIDNPDVLIANDLSIDEIRDRIGVDSLGYLSLEGLRKACEDSKISMCKDCFLKSYSTLCAKKDSFEI